MSLEQLISGDYCQVTGLAVTRKGRQEEVNSRQFYQERYYRSTKEKKRQYYLENKERILKYYRERTQTKPSATM